ncbi:MAG: hypothetical protein ABIS26_01940 [Candidatus Paceibacterota bacterium]
MNPPVAKAKGHSVLPWVIAGIATGAAIGICIAKCGDDKPEKKKEGTPPGGVTGPAFSRGFSFTLGVLGSH